MTENNRSRIGFHEGNTLRLVAEVYPTMLEAALELVQNSLDAGGSNVNVKVNYVKRTLTVEDDGDGVSKAKFEEALSKVCQTIKADDKMGQFGMGMVVGVGKCEYFTFTSCAKNNPTVYNQWKFVSRDIINSERISSIPLTQLSGMSYSKKLGIKNTFPWRTQVKLVNFMKNERRTKKFKIDINNLVTEIQSRFSEAIRTLNAKVTVEITSEDGSTVSQVVPVNEFKGKKLKAEYIRHPDAGVTAFELFIAPTDPKTRLRQGRVLIKESGRTFTLHIKTMAKYNELNSDAVKALCSGVFEGKITTDLCKLDNKRKGFIEDDSFVGFCETLDYWYETFGKEYYEEIQDSSEDERLQHLGSKSLGVLQSIINEFPALEEQVKMFSFGNIGKGHANSSQVAGEQEYTSSAGDKPRGAGTGGRERTGDSPKDSKDKVEKPNHKPLTTAGPKGQKRTRVQGGSQGLQIQYSDMDGETTLWHLNSTEGILNINRRHHVFQMVYRNDMALMRLQELIAIMAIIIETAPDPWQKAQQALISDSSEAIAFWLLHGDKIAQRGVGRKSSDTSDEKKSRSARA